MTTFLKVEQHTAQGVNLIFFIPTCIIAIIINARNKNIKYSVAIPVIITGMLGAVIGAKTSINMPIKELRKFFGIFLIIIAIHEMYSIKKEYIKNKKSNTKNIYNK